MKQLIDSNLTNQLYRIIEATKPIWNYPNVSPIAKEQFMSIAVPSEELHKDSKHEFRGLLNDKQRNTIANLFDLGTCTNAMVYPPMSYMEWHTNSDMPGVRTYYTYTEKEAVFRYVDPNTGNIVDDYDNIGWTRRSFTIDPQRPLWHTIWTEGVRFSFGFNNALPNVGTASK